MSKPMLFGPPECPYCPGLHHWPQNCNFSPEARARQQAAMLETIENMRLVAPEPFFTIIRTRSPLWVWE